MGLTSTLITSFIVSTTPALNADTEINKLLITSYIREEKRELTTLETEYNNLVKEVELFRTLGDDWDAYGAIQPKEVSIYDAISFLNILKEKSIAKPEVFPKTTGGTSIYWRNNNNYIEVSFKEEGTFSFFYDFEYDVYGEIDLNINNQLPDKLIYAINFIHRKVSSVKITDLIKTTETQQFLAV